jgi:hypothetical protein
MHRSWPLGLTLALLITAGAACSSASDSTGSAVVQPGGSNTSPAQGSKTSTASATAATNTDPIATAAGVGPGDGQTTIPVRIDVLSLERRAGDTVLLRFKVTNTGSALVRLGSNLGNGALAFDVSAVSLIDLKGNKRYLVMTDSNGSCVCSVLATSIEAIQPSESRVLEATFPAPPAGVSSFEVQVASFALVHDVPLSGTNG